MVESSGRGSLQHVKQCASAPGLSARLLRRETQFLLDVAALSLAFVVAYLLRFDLQIPERYLRLVVLQLPLVVLLQFLTLAGAGVYSLIWRFVGIADLPRFARAALWAALPLLLLRWLPGPFDAWRIPLSVILLDLGLAYGGVLGLRVLRRSVYETSERERRKGKTEDQETRRVLLVGAGRAGVLAIREMHGRRDLGLEPVGFVDDDPLKQGMMVDGVEVLGDTEDIPRLASELGIDHVILSIVDAPRPTLARIVATCERGGVAVRTVPGIYEILTGRVAISRTLDVDAAELLGRPAVRLEEENLTRLLTGKRVLVTGAGGSIGAELARQVCRLAPAELVLVDRSEWAVFVVDQELRELWPEVSLAPVVADIGHRERMLALFDKHRPEVVLHAAAHKHVPLMERNVAEAVQNNLIATRVLGELAAESGVQTFVLISTDKAVRPRSIMGATKRLAELVVADLAERHPQTRFLAVRFGNVLGSSGSVVITFRRQIERGGPVTVTHPEMTRYFMTAQEAARLVLEAAAIGSSGGLLILDMGEPVKILELTEQMIRLSGLEPYEEIPIEFIGLRPGEKLHEELGLGEPTNRTTHPKIFSARLAGELNGDLRCILDRLAALQAEADEEGIRRLLAEAIPEACLEQAGRDSPRPI